MSVKQSIKVTNAGLSPILSVAQGTGAIEYEFTVSDFDIPSGSAAVAYNIQPTGNIVSQTCSISGNTITVKPPAYYFLRGKNYMQFQVSRNNEDLFSFLIEVWCAPNISQPEVIVAENPSLVSQLISDVGLLSSQLDNLLSIPSGSLSTSADAALADIKVGWNGTTYDTPGDAVRGQIGELKDDLDEYNKVTNAIETTAITKGYIIDYVDGSVTSNQYTEEYAITDFIEINKHDRVYLAFVRGFNLCGGALYDSNKNYIKTIWGTDDWRQPSTDINKPFSFVVDSDDIKYIRYNIVEPYLLSMDKQYLKIQKLYDVKGFVDDVIKNNGSPVFYVSNTRTGSNVFTKLKDCTEYISNNNIQNATVYVDAETFDLVNEYGQEYLDSIQSTTNIGIGLHVGNNTHFIFSEGSKVVFNYTGTNEDCAEYFSPFNITGSVILENANIEVSNARYCVHEDLPTSADAIPDYSTVKYINCVMEHKGDTIPSGSHSGYACIGGGTNKNTLSIIKGGKYKSVWLAPITYHNYGGDYPSKIVLENVWLDKAFRLADFKTSEVEVQITGCYIPNGIIGAHTYFTITEWNNVLS